MHALFGDVGGTQKSRDTIAQGAREHLLLPLRHPKWNPNPKTKPEYFRIQMSSEGNI
jgi:hypothetical protein